MRRPYIAHPRDNCLVELQGNGTVVKRASCHIAIGGEIIRFGSVIGYSIKAFEPGEIIASNEVLSLEIKASDLEGRVCDARSRAHYRGQWQSVSRRMDSLSELVSRPRLFRRCQDGYERWGTRNHILILPSVNCSAFVAHEISRYTREYIQSWKADQHVGCFSINNPSGCGLDRSSTKYELLLQYYYKLIDNPNVFHCVIVSLGCEDAQPVELLARYPEIRYKTTIHSIQESAGTVSAISSGVEIAKQLVHSALVQQRVQAPFSAISLALQCGGSDAMSGVTANRLLGDLSDFIVSQDGKAVLSETPELYGSFNELADRCLDETVSTALMDIFLRWLCGYNGVDPSTNPAPGNLQGGILNSVEKSLGSSQKGGKALISNVIEYSHTINNLSGLIIMDSPGYDPVSATGQVLAGCNTLLFSTGRGSCFGIHPLPTVKVASTSNLFERYQGEIDIDAQSYDGSDKQLVYHLNYLMDVASGQLTPAEKLGYGSDEVVFWLDKNTN